MLQSLWVCVLPVKNLTSHDVHTHLYYSHRMGKSCAIEKRQHFSLAVQVTCADESEEDDEDYDKERESVPCWRSVPGCWGCQVRGRAMSGLHKS